MSEVFSVVGLKALELCPSQKERRVQAELSEQRAQRDRAEAELQETRARMHEQGLADDELREGDRGREGERERAGRR